MQGSPRVKCAKCGKSYYYALDSSIGGGALRFGSRRYMRCRKCGKFSLFSTGEYGAYPHERGLYNLIYGIIACVIGALFFVASSALAVVLVFSVAFFLVGIIFIARSISLISGSYPSKE